jgi:glycosyltransferase domain-containing protein
VSGTAALTIVLTLKDRVPFTERWLNYAATALRHRVLVADGGSDATVPAMVREANARGLDIEYVRYPYDRSYADYFAKLADALSRVTTPFVVMADNDDFFIAAGLRRAVDFLETHSDFVACGGQCAIFWTAGKDQAGQVYSDRVEFKCSSQYSTDSAETAALRLRERSLGANDIFYAVHRTALLRANFEAVRDCNPRDLYLMEQLVMFLTAIAGKTRQLDTLYIARQQDSPDRSGSEHTRRHGDWYDRMLAPTWSEDFRRFADCSAQALMRADNIAEADARRLVVDAYKASVAPSLLSDLVELPTVSWTMPIVLQVVRKLVNMPRHSWQRRFAQAAYRRARWLSHDFVRGTEIKTGRARDVAGEFSPVLDFLTAGHSSRTSGT